MGNFTAVYRPRVLAAKALVAALALIGAAQNHVVPPPGSTLRGQILGALRPKIEKQLGPNVEFKVALIRVENDWAVVEADPRRKGGKPIEGCCIFGDRYENMDSLRVAAVLRKKSGHWVLIDHRIGATDVWYCKQLPKSLSVGWARRRC